MLLWRDFLGMVGMSIAAGKYKKVLMKQLREHLFLTDDEGGEWICCHFGATPGETQDFCRFLADFLWSAHMTDYAVSRVKAFVRNKSLFEMDIPYDIRQVADKAVRFVRGCADFEEGSAAGKNGVIQTRLAAFCKGSHVLVLRGFTAFQLRDLLGEIDTAAELYLKDMVCEQEYHAFIELLQSFVALQEPALEEVHFVADAAGCHHILDADGTDITYHYIHDFVDQTGCGELTDVEDSDDLVITSLVTMAPHKIFLHNEKLSGNPQLIETIKSIFAGRVIME